MESPQKLLATEMKNKTIPLIYLLGAGRSGTTVIATVMNAHPNIQTAGELHQFFGHLLGDKDCSCGNTLATCEFWRNTSNNFQVSIKELRNWKRQIKKQEAHRNIPKYLFNKREYKDYCKIQELLFTNIKKETEGQWILDSSKYIGRYLLLKRSEKLKVRGVYVVRDVRGVIASFMKKVQTSRSPLSAILYYLMINTFAQLVCWMDREVVKVRYEDFMRDPERVVQEICGRISPTLDIPISLPSEFEMPHIIGGNRLRKHKTISLNFDEKWKTSIPRGKQILYYFLALPIMILNQYRP